MACRLKTNQSNQFQSNALRINVSQCPCSPISQPATCSAQHVGIEFAPHCVVFWSANAISFPTISVRQLQLPSYPALVFLSCVFFVFMCWCFTCQKFQKTGEPLPMLCVYCSVCARMVRVKFILSAGEMWEKKAATVTQLVTRLDMLLAKKKESKGNMWMCGMTWTWTPGKRVFGSPVVALISLGKWIYAVFVFLAHSFWGLGLTASHLCIRFRFHSTNAENEFSVLWCLVVLFFTFSSHFPFPLSVTRSLCY